MQGKKLFRIILVIIGAVIGYEIYNRFYFIPDLPTSYNILYNSLAIVIGGIVGFLVSSLFTIKLQQIIHNLQKVPTKNIIAAIFGLIVGLVIANLLAYSLSFIPLIGSYLPIILNVVLGLIGVSVGLSKGDEIVNFFGYFKNVNKAKRRTDKVSSCAKVLDTSAIIDGRILDICQTGFLEGDLIIPRFVLSELQHIADSSDSLKRNRGRRGLDILNKIIKINKNKVKIVGKDYREPKEVDAKIIKFAKEINAKIITTDYNLNKIAQLEGVLVLNINDLSNALKAVILPGEEIAVQIIKEGKEPEQGVAYLNDGTMIVIEDGNKYIGKKVNILVTSILQTPAGRMIFGKIKMVVDNNKSSKLENYRRAFSGK